MVKPIKRKPKRKPIYLSKRRMDWKKRRIFQKKGNLDLTKLKKEEEYSNSWEKESNKYEHDVQQEERIKILEQDLQKNVFDPKKIKIEERKFIDKYKKRVAKRDISKLGQIFYFEYLRAKLRKYDPRYSFEMFEVCLEKQEKISINQLSRLLRACGKVAEIYTRSIREFDPKLMMHMGNMIGIITRNSRFNIKQKEMKLLEIANYGSSKINLSRKAQELGDILLGY